MRRKSRERRYFLRTNAKKKGLFPYNSDKKDADSMVEDKLDVNDEENEWFNRIDIEEDQSLLFHQKKVVDEKEKGDIDLKKIYLKDIEQFHSLTKGEEEELCRRMENGDEEARELLILSNTNLGLTIARKYHFWGLSELDIIQAVNIGIMEALKKYDHNKGPFAAFAWKYSKGEINKAIKESGQRSKFVRAKRRKINKLQDDLCQRLNRDPTVTEVAKEMGTTGKKLLVFLASTQPEISLDAPASREDCIEASSIGETVKDEHAENPEMATITSIEIKKMNAALACLSERERIIVKARSGYYTNNGSAVPYHVLAAFFHISNERARQIYECAIIKLYRYMRKLDLH